MRRAGQTYQMLLRTILHATSNPNHRCLVAFLARPTADHAARMLWSMLRPIANDGFAGFHYPSLVWRFNNGSTIDFTVAEGDPDVLRGTWVNKVETDHSVDRLPPEWEEAIRLALARTSSDEANLT
jgi:hypothetical protein